MQNFSLLKEVGKVNKPVLLKRGIAATIKEWLMSAEYILANGNFNVILCERGIRTFETATRNTLDISAVAVVKQLSHLPVIVDPSHATGKWDYVGAATRGGVCRLRRADDRGPRESGRGFFRRAAVLEAGALRSPDEGIKKRGYGRFAGDLICLEKCYAILFFAKSPLLVWVLWAVHWASR